MIRNVTPFLLSIVFFTNTVACSKATRMSSINTQLNNRNSQVTTLNPTESELNSVPAGAIFATQLTQEISTAKNYNQEQFILKEKHFFLGRNPVLKEAQIVGHLEDVVKASRGEKASLRLVFDKIILKNGKTLPIDASLVNTQLQTKTKSNFLRNAGVILGGVAIGHFLGTKTGMRYGVAKGAAGATAFVLLSPSGEVVLKRGTVLKLKLNSTLSVK